MNFPDNIAGYKATFNAIPHPRRLNSNRHSLVLHDGFEKVAEVKWDYDNKCVWVIEIYVEEKYRKQKVATSIYDDLQKITGTPVKWIPNAWASNEMREFAKKYIQDCHSVIASKVDY